MPERITIQDIADALGVSRNTVSKAINNTGTIADSTRERILQKAVEMGYKQFSYVSLTNGTNVTAQLTTPQQTIPGDFPIPSVPESMPASPKNTIALFTGSFLGNSHFSSTMLDKFQRELTYFGYSLTMHRITGEDFQKQALPISFNPEITAGIICFEIFDPAYSEMLCSLDIPLLFVDTPAVYANTKLKADQLLMDNRTNIITMIQRLYEMGMKQFGFIGKAKHCKSFYERYMAFRQALIEFGLPYHEEFCLLDTGEKGFETADYQAYLTERLSSMKKLPDVFLCANDFIAIDTLQVMRRLHISVPDDVRLCGFDDSTESRIVTPPLTTIHIHSQIMGISAVQLLTTRIKQPSMNYRTVYTETSLIFRESTLK